VITQRIAHVLGLEINGTAWETVCLAKGLDPASATAEDILGPFPTRMTHDGGKRVLWYDAELLADLVEVEPSPRADAKQFVREVAEIARLTRLESRLVHAIVDGSPIPDGKNYTGPLARRFRTSTDAIKKTWSRAKKKLRDNWAA
jgi:hypothetical protein